MGQSSKPGRQVCCYHASVYFLFYNDYVEADYVSIRYICITVPQAKKQTDNRIYPGYVSEPSTVVTAATAVTGTN